MATKKTIKVTQTGSVLGREKSQEATLRGLGLTKRLRTRVLEDTPAIRGMIHKVKHLVRVDENA
jgi:large subunit ribosomal protein L30